MENLVMKFGGTSVGSIEALSAVERIVGAAPAPRLTVVVSAMNGVTDLLEEGIRRAMRGDAARHRQIADELRQRHAETAAALLGAQDPALLAEFEALIEEYARFCDSVRVLGEVTPRALDHTMGLGERLNARLVAAMLRAGGIPSTAVDATDLIVTDDRHQNASPIFEFTRPKVKALLEPLHDQGLVPVVTGFIAATAAGVDTTLGRGGSDYSASILGICLDCDEVWIWTDVDGVMSADPRIVPTAHTIEQLSYREISELAYFGAKVVHAKTIRPVVDAGIPLRVKNTFNPAHPGTLITARAGANGGVKAVTAIKNVGMVTVEGAGMMGVPGIAGRTFASVAATDTSVLLILQASSEQSICFVVPRDNSQGAAAVVRQEFEREIARRDIDQVCVREDITIVTVVGAGMRDTPGIAGRIFTATGEAGINVIAIAQGSSEVGISLMVTDADCDAAVAAIHRLAIQPQQA